MTLPLRWRIACAISSLFAIAALATPADGAPLNTSATVTDQSGDTRLSNGTPYGLDRADITGSTATFKTSEIIFTLVTANPDNPRTSPNWAQPTTGISWLLRTASAAPGYDYELRYTVANGVPIAKVYAATDTTRTSPLCDAMTASYSDSGRVYRSSLDPACIGKPQTIAFGAAISYQLDEATLVTDGPDNFSATLSKPRAGYWLVGRDGGIFAFGNAAFAGSTGAMKLNQPIVGMASNPVGTGYWFVAADGGIFAFGDAGFFGSTGAMKLNKPIVGMAATPTGQGYYLVASDGGIFSFGDARFRGSTGNIKLNKPIVGMAAARNGRGYWLVASDGGIFSFGNGADFFGSAGSIKLSQPIVGMAAAPNNKGYWFVAADGGIFNYGPGAEFHGTKLGGSPVTGITAAPDGRGYWITRASGEVAGFGSVPTLGSLASAPASPIVGLAALSLPEGEEQPAQ